jgi:hypothetical protein
MDVQELAAVADIVGAIAVVVTLIYLAVQLRQSTKQIEENTRAVRAAALHAGISYAIDNRNAISSTHEMASIYARGSEDPHSLDGVELLRFRLTMANFVDTLWNMYSQSKMTGFSPETWAAQINIARRVFGTNGGKWFWNAYRLEYDEQLRREIDALIERNA